MWTAKLNICTVRPRDTRLRAARTSQVHVFELGPKKFEMNEFMKWKPWAAQFSDHLAFTLLSNKSCTNFELYEFFLSPKNVHLKALQPSNSNTQMDIVFTFVFGLIGLPGQYWKYLSTTLLKHFILKTSFSNFRSKKNYKIEICPKIFPKISRLHYQF